MKKDISCGDIYIDEITLENEIRIILNLNDPNILEDCGNKVKCIDPDNLIEYLTKHFFQGHAANETDMMNWIRNHPLIWEDISNQEQFLKWAVEIQKIYNMNKEHAQHEFSEIKEIIEDD